MAHLETSKGAVRAATFWALVLRNLPLTATTQANIKRENKNGMAKPIRHSHAANSLCWHHDVFKVSFKVMSSPQLVKARAEAQLLAQQRAKERSETILRKSAGANTLKRVPTPVPPAKSSKLSKRSQRSADEDDDDDDDDDSVVAAAVSTRSFAAAPAAAPAAPVPAPLPTTFPAPAASAASRSAAARASVAFAAIPAVAPAAPVPAFAPAATVPAVAPAAASKREPVKKKAATIAAAAQPAAASGFDVSRYSIRPEVLSIAAEIVANRRHLHQHPELSYQEFNTSAFIVSKLTEYGIPLMSGVAKTGVVGLIVGDAGPGPCIALRADMDALPILEATDRS
jgi:hypothetical protein